MVVERVMKTKVGEECRGRCPSFSSSKHKTKNSKELESSKDAKKFPSERVNKGAKIHVTAAD